MTKDQLVHSIAQLAAVKVTVSNLDINPEVKARDIAALDAAIGNFAEMLADICAREAYEATAAVQRKLDYRRP